ncbi:Spindle pole body-associated protein sad1 [Grifola frondosa]|uniref:Spindle pole body-associated protein sad1 n=1 Tax=Grifola frondosa TaxID=5627 RepID=A0A1C7M6P7_GRIFR|nr:Spindle pole body-associated protein sad1 [Grifola frondosa]
MSAQSVLRTVYLIVFSDIHAQYPNTPNPDRHPFANAAHDDNPDEPALVRFARLKREQADQSRSSAATASSHIRALPHPEKWSVKDTSVNIAGAFNQAATSADDIMPPANPNEAWASGARKPAPHRSTVRREGDTVTTASRRLAQPPRRLGASRVVRPISKTHSVQHVPDSEGEEVEEVHNTSRGKSPFEQVIEATKRMVPTAFFMKERSQEPENESLPLNGNSGLRDQSSYDYSAEERDFEASSGQIPPSRRTIPNRKRNRLSSDSKAYRPSMSDLEESDEDFAEDRKRTKRKKGKKNGALDMKRRRRKRENQNGMEEDEDDDSSDSQEEVDEEPSHHNTTPQQRSASQARASAPPHSRVSAPLASRTSVPRASVPPHHDSSNVDSFLDVEQALGSTAEEEEEPPLPDGSHEDIPRPSFSVGASLGRGVHWLFRLSGHFFQMIFGFCAWVVMVCGRMVAASFNLFIGRPVRAISSAHTAQAGKYIVVGLTIYAAWYALQRGWFEASFPLRTSRPTFQPPSIPAADISELATRLQSLENALSSLSLDSERSRMYMEGDARSHAELVGRLGQLESRVQKESIRALDTESRFRVLSSEGLQAVKKEVELLSAQVQAQREQDSRTRPTTGNDEEARAKLRGVKEAMELQKNSAKAGVLPGNAAAWWNKLVSGNGASPVTIKSTDGQDVTSLISHLVEAAVSRTSKDTLARPDFALHSAGARVIASLTSETMEITPMGLKNQILGYLTGGNGFAVGRPPVTALHHEIHTGHCWPFPGTQGQLGVALSAPVYISDVTIDHVAKEVAIDMRSAPRQMELWGLLEGKENIEKVKEWRAQRDEWRKVRREEAERSGQPYVEETEEYPKTLPKTPEYIRIANFTYNIHAPENIQTFPVRQEIHDLGVDFGVVVLLVKSNWGRDELTCLYRLRVHGEQMGEVPLPYPEEAAA